MPYTARIYREGEGAREVMALVNSWLSERQLRPDRFRCAIDLKGVSLQLDFLLESEATAFADDFGGTVTQLFGRSGLRTQAP